MNKTNMSYFKKMNEKERMNNHLFNFTLDELIERIKKGLKPLGTWVFDEVNDIDQLILDKLEKDKISYTIQQQRNGLYILSMCKYPDFNIQDLPYKEAKKFLPNQKLEFYLKNGLDICLGNSCYETGMIYGFSTCCIHHCQDEIENDPKAYSGYPKNLLEYTKTIQSKIFV